MVVPSGFSEGPSSVSRQGLLRPAASINTKASGRAVNAVVMRYVLMRCMSCFSLESRRKTWVMSGSAPSGCLDQHQCESRAVNAVVSRKVLMRVMSSPPSDVEWNETASTQRRNTYESLKAVRRPNCRRRSVPAQHLLELAS